MIILDLQVAYDGNRVGTRYEVPLGAANAGLLARQLGSVFTPVDEEEGDAIRQALIEHFETVLVRVLMERGKVNPKVITEPLFADDGHLLPWVSAEGL